MVYRKTSTGEPVLIFNMLDEILDFLLSIGLRPLIQLGDIIAKKSKQSNTTVKNFLSVDA
jgi:hypothetical protein